MAYTWRRDHAADLSIGHVGLNLNSFLAIKMYDYYLTRKVEIAGGKMVILVLGESKMRLHLRNYICVTILIFTLKL